MPVQRKEGTMLDVVTAVVFGGILLYICYAIWRDDQKRKEKQRIRANACKNIKVQDLYVYPIKACKGMRVNSSKLTNSGLQYDREWMFFNVATKTMVSQRDFPCMAWIEPKLSFDSNNANQCNGLYLNGPKMESLFVPIAKETDSNRVEEIKIFSHNVVGVDQGTEASKWVSNYFNNYRRSLYNKKNANTNKKFVEKEYRLMRICNENTNRHELKYIPKFLGGFMEVERAPVADIAQVKDKEQTSEFRTFKAYSDGFPLLIVSQASLDEMNKRLENKQQKAVTMERFRPNMVISAMNDDIDELEPFIEDKIDHLTVKRNNTSFYLTKPCARCTVPTIDPITTEKNVEVTKTLREFRKGEHLGLSKKSWKEDVFFGMNACHDSRGDIAVGDGLLCGPLKLFG